MDAIEQLKQDVREGRIDVDRLIDVIVAQQKQLEAAKQRIEELEKKAGCSAKVEAAFSMRAEEKRQQARGKNKKHKLSKKGRRGRLTTFDKLKLAERTEKCFPDGVPHQDCHLSHTRPVWRLQDGRAVLIAYEIYRGPKNQYGKIPGVLGRSEFGMEIVVEIAYFVYVIGLSFDKVCLTLRFLQNLPLGKTQADSLLKQLSRHWQHEFEVLCTLLANSLVVHSDETSWSINSVWAFLSEKARLVLFGVHKDANTLEQILDPHTFAGLVISDDAAVYANFSQAQKCWAHLLRKAIKLTLQEPDNLEYRQFTDRLLEIYRAACRVQRDGRLSAVGRARKIAGLDDEILDLCAPQWVPGYFARVRVPIGLPHQALLVSDRALDTDQGQKIVYVVNDKDEVVSRPVQLGALHNGLREITEGVKPGERVIVNGLQQVRPGLIVEPKVVDMPGQNPKSEVRNPKQIQTSKSK